MQINQIMNHHHHYQIIFYFLSHCFMLHQSFIVNLLFIFPYVKPFLFILVIIELVAYRSNFTMTLIYN